MTKGFCTIKTVQSVLEPFKKQFKLVAMGVGTQKPFSNITK
jgi:hypothetical protein